ncbi:MaoC family dehydratase [Leucobacter celer]|jgi:acyl dehydratase|uniref:MaoC family dehydratase n=1 Tax=Leucobacter celer TaxID=668625 RepID=UPI0006A7CC70|nr:MaoC/PaaZ C-terminal domain-containing protein [Leucobacter celer]
MSTIPRDFDIEHESVFAKTVGEYDIYSFAGITGDFSPNHVNAEFMSETPYGERIAHGVLILGYASTVASQYVRETGAKAVSYGYDRVRFIGAVRIGDTVTLRYRVTGVDRELGRTTASVTAVNQVGETVLAAEHILHFI